MTKKERATEIRRFFAKKKYLSNFHLFMCGETRWECQNHFRDNGWKSPSDAEMTKALEAGCVYEFRVEL